ncbi:DNA dC-_dU-editing enzyme APOBEC-3-like isoform X2 [Octodon degus]|uniref:single-stranded DNA cytosine deaminase n=1 Tax=Octodon degus TaxID=10160 RepID=A0A6P6ER69_OCTDE|nr:DNA dC->dU-editing enzyme APOBEC-3-like isoform X2 [Octodon degus]
MERQGWSGRDRLRNICPRGCRWTSDYRKPFERIYKKAFYFYFRNLQYAHGRNNTFLCCKIIRERDNQLWKEVFLNQVGPHRLHAELCFLSWLHDINLSLDETYKVTWYVTWSPCNECAEEIAEFLTNHKNVTLTIFNARLYYFWKPAFKEGLRALADRGASVNIMDLSDFKDCWNLFVCNKTFKPWKKFYKYYLFQDETLSEILRREMPLREETFRVQFNNAHKAPKPFCRRVTYLCYQLQEASGGLVTKGCLRTKKGQHAEIRFIERIHSMALDQARSYQITCFLTWSPCPFCAQELASFKSTHPRVHLQIFVSRLYFHWKRSYQEGLQRLCTSKVPLAVMGHQEFDYCWNNFVDHKSGPFEPWDKLEYYILGCG